MLTEHFFSDNRYAFIIDALKKAELASGARVYLVGGAVRDLLLDRAVSDLDFVVFGFPYEQFAKKAARLMGSHAVAFKQNRRIPYNKGYIDISEPRGETLSQDLLKRDFTINNLAIGLDGEITGNTSDLEAGLIRPVHKEIFDDDPLRLLRGFRQAAALSFTLTEEFLRLARLKVPLIKTTAAERITAELRKLCGAPSLHIYREMNNISLWEAVLGFKPDEALLLKAAKIATQFPPESGFALFLAASGAENFKRLSLDLSGNERKTATLLANFSLSEKESVLRETVWKNYENFSLLKAIVELKGLDKDIFACYERFYEKLEPSRAMLVTGDDLLALAPTKPKGGWIAKILTDVKIKLAVGELMTRQEALNALGQSVDKV